MLVGGLATGACRGRAPPPLTGTLLGTEQAERGHRLRTPTGPARFDRAVDLVIVGAGVAGVSAAWRLAKAGWKGRLAWFDLGDQVGGTSGWGDGPRGQYPWGAHYLVMPGREAVHVRDMLADLGVITGFDSDGRPRYDPEAVCLAPQERVFAWGEWAAGLVPPGGDAAQFAAFEAELDSWKRRLGADGLPAFSIPVALSSRDPEILAYHHISFASWLDARGYTDPVLRWTQRYAVRDDFGTELDTTSAWAALHYHCSRRPDPADARDLGTNVLTWPAGNGFLVWHLLRRVPWAPTLGAVVRSVRPEEGVVRIVVDTGELREVTAAQVILAVPGRVAGRLLDREIPSPDLAPWRIAQLHCDRPPASVGVPLAWDSVIYDGRGLGYVSNAHQSASYGGPTVLTWYQPQSEGSPADAREALGRATWEEAVDVAFSELSPAHRDLRERVDHVDVWHWGHGTARPVPGVDPSQYAAATRPHPRVWLAHTDRSGISLFEEASWHGVRAADDLLAGR